MGGGGGGGGGYLCKGSKQGTRMRVKARTGVQALMYVPRCICADAGTAVFARHELVCVYLRDFSFV